MNVVDDWALAQQDGAAAAYVAEVEAEHRRLDVEEVLDGEVVEPTTVVPYTGEALALPDMSYEQLGKLLDNARVFERSVLSAFKQEVQDEILARMDAAAKEGAAGAWTVHAEGGVKLSGDSPNRTDYEVDTVRRALKQLVAEGEIKEDVIATVIVPERYKVAKRQLTQLLKLGGRVAEVLKECEQPVTRPRRVTVTLEVR